MAAERLAWWRNTGFDDFSSFSESGITGTSDGRWHYSVTFPGGAPSPARLDSSIKFADTKFLVLNVDRRGEEK